MSRGKQQGEDWWRRSRAQGRPPLSSMDGVDGGSTHGTARPSVHGSNLPWHNVHQSFLWNWKEGNWTKCFSLSSYVWVFQLRAETTHDSDATCNFEIGGEKTITKTVGRTEWFLWYRLLLLGLYCEYFTFFVFILYYMFFLGFSRQKIMFCSFSDFNDPSHAGNFF